MFPSGLALAGDFAAKTLGGTRSQPARFLMALGRLDPPATLASMLSLVMLIMPGHGCRGPTFGSAFLVA
jgi:hypothetical protein